MNFNPRPREEGDNDRVSSFRAEAISIHALVKRATALEPLSQLEGEISIHALVKRATVRRLYHRLWFCHFNPRPREEGDRRKGSRLPFYNNFNPRPREEGDWATMHPKQIISNFNPRPREEGDKYK